MTSINDVLKASKDVYVEDTFAMLWGRKLSSDYTIAVYTGTLPAVLTGTKAGYLHRYKIYGNTEQTGTPTPENPIVPSECGERTGNLFDGELLRGFYQTINNLSGNLNIYRSFRIQGLPAGTYTVAWAIPVRLVRVWRDNTLYENVAENITSYTVNTSNGDIAFSFRDERSNVYWDDSTWVMLNSGSTPLPYEPYGYKLPLTSSGQNVDIYLGESQTTRRIKKLVLTGEETPASITQTTDGNNYCVAYRYSDLGMTDIKDYDELTYLCSYPVFISSHFTMKSIEGLPLPNNYYDIQPGQVGGNTWIAMDAGVPTYNRYIIFCVSGITTINDFKTYLTQQYANGTPVTIWYVLATEETGTLNEPLRKIGNYADTLDSTQTTAQIPTTANSTTISWGGSGLAPSQVEFEYERRR